MDTRKIFTYIKADRFFADYLPSVRNYKHKIAGHNSRGNPLDFSEEEKREIKKGLQQLFKDLMKSE